MTSKVLKESLIRKAIGEAVADGQVSVSVADPRSADAYLIAVSDQFEIMTGANQTVAKKEDRDERFKQMNIF